MKPALLIAVAIVFTTACNTGRNNSAWSEKPPATPATTAAPSTPVPAPATAISSGKGVGPVDHVDMAALDESKEEAGAKLFQEKCSACHKLGERYVGPALAGVTQRRQPEWILNMILNPENMIQNDPTAKGLLATYIAPMANQHLTREEAECVLVYFREHDEEATEAEHDGDLEGEESSSGHAGSGR